MITTVILKNTELGDDFKQQSSGDPFWERAETSLLQAIIYYLYYFVDNPNLPKLFDFVVDNDNSKIEEIFTKLPDSREGRICKKAFSIFLKAPETLRGNIVLGLATRIDILLMPEARYLTERSDFSIYDIKDKKNCCLLVYS